MYLRTGVWAWMEWNPVMMYKNGDQRDTGKSTGTSFGLCTRQEVEFQSHCHYCLKFSGRNVLPYCPYPGQTTASTPEMLPTEEDGRDGARKEVEQTIWQGRGRQHVALLRNSALDSKKCRKLRVGLN